MTAELSFDGQKMTSRAALRRRRTGLFGEHSNTNSDFFASSGTNMMAVTAVTAVVAT
jgi:hypothetical protein